MTCRIGIIGAENSHTAAIADTLNVQRKVADMRVEYVWGETEAAAREAASAGQIPHIVEEQSDMQGRIDALVVDHRHPKEHLPAALPFIRDGVPTFIDKPLCYRSEEGKAFLKTATQRGAPVTTFSVLPMQESTRAFLDHMNTLGQIRAASFYGPSNLESKYGGIFFYGIHQVDMAIEAFGTDVQQVLLTRNGDNATAQLLYGQGRIVTLNLIKEGASGFACCVAGTEGYHHRAFAFDSDNPYLTGIQTFCQMFKERVEPISHERMLRPIQVLEALERSLESGRVETV